MTVVCANTDIRADIREKKFPLRLRVADGLGACSRPVLFPLDGRDFTAGQVAGFDSRSRRSRCRISDPCVPRGEFVSTDDTFPNRSWRGQGSAWTPEWLQ